jgi:hypothetical protein
MPITIMQAVTRSEVTQQANVLLGMPYIIENEYVENVLKNILRTGKRKGKGKVVPVL